MISVRRGVFETNSSSTHSITMCSENEYDKWENGELLLDRYDKVLMTKEECKKMCEEEGEDECRYISYEQFWNDMDYETFEKSYTTKVGEKVIAFGYYGYDG